MGDGSTTESAPDSYVPALPFDMPTHALNQHACDTLEDAPYAARENATTLFAHAAKRMCEQSGVVGVLLVGKQTLTPEVITSWGLRSDVPTRLTAEAVYGTLVHLKSWPPDRLGQPLAEHENRWMSLLFRTSVNASETTATICTLHMWRRPESDHSSLVHDDKSGNGCAASRRRSLCTMPRECMITEEDLKRGRRAVYGIGCLGVHLFPHHGRRLLEQQKLTHGRRQYHAVLGSAIGVVRGAKPDGQAVMSTDPIHRVVLAAAIHGTLMHDLPARRPPMRVLMLDVVQQKQRESAQCLWQLASKEKTVSCDSKQAEYDACRLAADAAAVSERVSLRGVVHLLAILGPSQLPEGLWKCERNALGLMVALAVRIALHPRAVGLDEGDCPHEALARASAQRALEAVVPGLHVGKLEEAPHFMLDAVIHTTVKSITRALEPETPDGKHGGHAQTCEIDDAVHESLRCLQSFGVALVLDAFGAPEPLHADFGTPCECLASEMDMAVHRHWKRLAGPSARDVNDDVEQLGSCIPGLATRSALQHTVVRLLVQAEQSLAPPPPAAINICVSSIDAKDDTKDHAKDDGVVGTPVPQASPVAVAVPIGRRIAEQATSVCSSTKKKGRKKPKDKPANSSRTKPVSTHSEAAPTESQTSRAVEASEFLEDVLELGCMAGLNHLVEPRAFLVSPSMLHACGRCGCATHVVASLMFAGPVGTCRSCHAPFCTDCAHLVLLAALASNEMAFEQLSCCVSCLQATSIRER